MSELDTMGRHHAEVVRSALANAEPPPLESIVTITPDRPKRGLLVASAMAAVVVAALLPLGLLPNQTGPADPETPVTTPSDSTSPAPEASITLPAEPTLLPFDLEEFMWGKLDGVFGDTEDQIGVIVLVPGQSESKLEEVVVSELEELEGFSRASTDQVAAAAERYAASNDMFAMEGVWVAYGLIPRYADSPVEAWEVTLLGVPNAIVLRVDYQPPPGNVPEEWTVVTELPFAIASGAMVLEVGSDVVVVGPDSTWRIRPDGSWVTGEEPPMPIPEFCCESEQAIPGPGSVILFDENTVATWILDVETMTWGQAEPRPAKGYVLGSTLIEGELHVVTAAGRRPDAVALLSALDLASGTWRELEPVPSAISVGRVTSDRDRLIVGGTHQGPNNNILGANVVYEYNTATGWNRLPDNPISGQASTVVWVEGVGLVSWNYDLESAVLDDSGEWQRLEQRVPMSPAECLPRAVPVPDGVVGLCGGIAWFDTASRQWTPIRSPNLTRVAVTPTALIGLVEIDRDQTQMIAHPLPPGRD